MLKNDETSDLKSNAFLHVSVQPSFILLPFNSEVDKACAIETMHSGSILS